MDTQENQVNQFLGPYFPKKNSDVVSANVFFRDLEVRPARFIPQIPTLTYLKRKLISFFVSYFKIANFFSFYFNEYPAFFYWQSILDYLYSHKLIKFNKFNLGHIFYDEPKVFDVSLTPNINKTDGREPAIFSKGRSESFDEAASKAIGEFLERYFFVIYNTSDFLGSSIEELSKKKKIFLDPLKYQIFSMAQKNIFPFYRFSDKHFFYWVKGKSLTKNKSAFIPAQFVYWNYKHEKEPILRQPITSGAGGMFSREEAIVSGIYELIERDTFLSYWLLMEPPEVIIHESIRSQKVRDIIYECEKYGIEVNIFIGKNEFNIPVFFVILMDQYEKGPSLAMGASSSFDYDRAIYQAINEALSVRHWIRTQESWDAISLSDCIPFFDTKINQPNRLMLWSQWGMRKHINFFLCGPRVELDYSQERKFDDGAKELSHLISLVSKFSYEVFVYEIKSKILKDLGYYVVKVFIPNLLPIYVDEKYVPLGSERLDHLRKFFKKNKNSPINKIPHPFP